MQQNKKRNGLWHSCRIVLLHLVIIGLAFVGLLVGLSYWLESYTHHGESVAVPAVVGVDGVDAAMLIRQMGLVPVYSDTVFSDDVAPGAVVEQSVEGGMPVKLGHRIYLTVCSRHKQTKVMPALSQILGGGLRNAQSLLRHAGFRPDSVTYVPHEFDDEVLAVKTLDGTPVVEGAAYEIRTLLRVEVGSTQLEADEETDETIEGDWME